MKHAVAMEFNNHAARPAEPGSSTMNARVGYKIRPEVTIGPDVFNLSNKHVSAIDQDDGSQPPGEPSQELPTSTFTDRIEGISGGAEQAIPGPNGLGSLRLEAKGSATDPMLPPHCGRADALVVGGYLLAAIHLSN